MKKKIIIPIIIIAVIVIGFSYLKLSKPSDGFVEKNISQNEAIAFLNDLSIDKSLLANEGVKREVYNDMDFPSDGERYVILKLNDSALGSLTDTYKINREKDSEGKVALLKEVSKDEALRKLDDYSDEDELLKMIRSDFTSKNGHFFVKEVASMPEDKDDEDDYDNHYILFLDDENTLYAYNMMS